MLLVIIGNFPSIDFLSRTTKGELPLALLYFSVVAAAAFLFFCSLLLLFLCLRPSDMRHQLWREVFGNCGCFFFSLSLPLFSITFFFVVFLQPHRQKSFYISQLRYYLRQGGGNAQFNIFSLKQFLSFAISFYLCKPLAKQKRHRVLRNERRSDDLKHNKLKNNKNKIEQNARR